MTQKAYLYRRIVQAKLFIDEHYASAIDVSQVATEASFSKFHFLRLFKSIYGSTPHRYLTRVRLEAAKRLLATGTSVSETCELVGFESMGSFSSLFTRHEGIQPSAYLMREKNMRARRHAAPKEFIPGCFFRSS